VKLAADRERRLEMRQTLRERMRNGPLGDTEAFARDFYDMLANALAGQKTAARA
jgi:predicted O-linked N-acetylglucosamine transferase (SPINDLY family)